VRAVVWCASCGRSRDASTLSLPLRSWLLSFAIESRISATLLAGVIIS
jgi:hypothetical protein